MCLLTKTGAPLNNETPRRHKVGQALVVRGNAAAIPLADESVDLIVTSPPYFALRNYQDAGEAYAAQIGMEPTPAEFLDALWTVTAECRRVLKQGGSMFFNINDKYNSAASNQNGLGATLQGGSHDSNRIGRGSTVDLVPVKSLLGLPWRYAIGLLDGKAGGEWILRSDMIWNKTNGMLDPTRDRAARRHEYLFHFTKNGKYFANPDEVRKLKSVWDLPTEGLLLPKGAGKHPAPFPLAMPAALIRGWCPEGGVVLDPFGGSGTTALAAWANGRTGISLDLSQDYSVTALSRSSDPKNRERALNR
jgi:DNA modification methylase